MKLQKNFAKTLQKLRFQFYELFIFQNLINKM
jgi:hypothetical protein